MKKHSITKIVGALSLGALATVGCKSSEEKPADGQGAEGGQASCSGKTDKEKEGGQGSCSGQGGCGGSGSCGGH